MLEQDCKLTCGGGQMDMNSGKNAEKSEEKLKATVAWLRWMRASIGVAQFPLQ